MNMIGAGKSQQLFISTMICPNLSQLRYILNESARQHIISRKFRTSCLQLINLKSRRPSSGFPLLQSARQRIQFQKSSGPPPPAGSGGGGSPPPRPPPNSAAHYARLAVFLIAINFLLSFLFTSNTDTPGGIEEVDWNTFRHEVLAKGEAVRITIFPRMEYAIVDLAPGAIIQGRPIARDRLIIRPSAIQELEKKVREAEVDLNISAQNSISIVYKRSNDFLSTLIPLSIMLAIGYTIFRATRRSSIGLSTMSNPFVSFTTFRADRGIPALDSVRKANYKVVGPESSPNIKFKDVAGLHEAKQEVREFVDYLKKPYNFTRLGAKIPKGALLLGPPGCGKTLLAKAVATETDVSFLAINGTDFVEMIGGLGASRIRDLFKDARSRSPCIIFMDEIDAIGKKRSESGGSMGGGGSGEQDQTLNQLLVELDGIDTAKGVILFAATNRADVLDKALLRPGRFDRHITIDLPTLLEREEIFQLYLKKLKLENDDELKQYALRLAQLSPGMSGADIFNVCNEAALHAATNNYKNVTGKSLDYAMERVIAGPEKRSKTLSKEEKTRVAYHESGHALVGWLLEHTDALLRVTIVPRTSAALGFAQYAPSDRKLLSKEELYDRMCMTLGGRAAENIIFGQVSTGAQNDLEKVTKLAYDQIRVYGMSEVNPPLSFPPDPTVGDRQSEFLKKPYSKQMALQFDLIAATSLQMMERKLSAFPNVEARQMVAKAYWNTEELIRKNKDKLEKMTQELLKREVLTFDEVKQIIGPPKFKKKHFVERVEQLIPEPYPEP